MPAREYAAIVVGASFAGLAVARQLRGHVLLLAELPAMIPMCPPGIRNSSVSVLLTFDRIGSDWHGGVM